MILLCEVPIKLALQLSVKASWFTAENAKRDLCVIDSGIVSNKIAKTPLQTARA